MKQEYDPERHNRRSIRLRGYDYTQGGAYFVTLCTHNRACLFGEVVDGVARLNPLGACVEAEWLRTETVRPHVALDAFVVMPNHFHAIIVLSDAPPHDAIEIPQANRHPVPTSTASGSVGAIVQQFKSVTSKRIKALRNAPGAPVWQRGYYDRIIRDDKMLNAIRQYIMDNPARWEEDPEHPKQWEKANRA
ncbi:MAG: transposase [Anaerolineae bacterium]